MPMMPKDADMPLRYYDGADAMPLLPCRADMPLLMPRLLTFCDAFMPLCAIITRRCCRHYAMTLLSLLLCDAAMLTSPLFRDY